MALVVCTWALPKEANEGSQSLQLSELISNAQKNINELAANIKTQLNIPDQDTVVNTLKNQSSTFVNNVQQYITSVSEEVNLQDTLLFFLVNYTFCF
jgi:polyribonucleotide nucleotidyltransferase